MLLCIDVGNSTIFGGAFTDDELRLQFRYPSDEKLTSDQLGLFFRYVLKENGLNPQKVRQVGYCSVVPSLDYALRAAFIKYFSQEPFILKAGVKTGLKILSKNPQEVGSDRIAHAIAAMEHFPNRNIIVVNFGTATTLDVISAKAEYLGGAILPGMKIAMQSLTTHTAKLPPVPIIKAPQAMGQTTVGNIQSGLYYGHVGAIKHLIEKLSVQAFTTSQSVVTIGTGDFVSLFEHEALFSCTIPALSLHGLRLTLLKNQV